jgi:hypothetical protein
LVAILNHAEIAKTTASASIESTALVASRLSAPVAYSLGGRGGDKEIGKRKNSWGDTDSGDTEKEEVRHYGAEPCCAARR